MKIPVQSGEVDDLIEEVSRRLKWGLSEKDMTIHINESVHKNLIRDVGLRYYKGPLGDVSIDKIAGVDVARSDTEEPKIEYKTPQCGSCNTQKLFHDTKEKYLCAWCEI